jgi:hypothetical protein
MEGEPMRSSTESGREARGDRRGLEIGRMAYRLCISLVLLLAAAPISAREVLYEEDFESGAPDWIVENGVWEIEESDEITVDHILCRLEPLCRTME